MSIGVGAICCTGVPAAAAAVLLLCLLVSIQIACCCSGLHLPSLAICISSDLGGFAYQLLKLWHSNAGLIRSALAAVPSSGTVCFSFFGYDTCRHLVVCCASAAVCGELHCP